MKVNINNPEDNCLTPEEFIDLLQYGSFNRSQHLLSCSKCSKILKELNDTLQFLKEAFPPKDFPDITEKVLKDIQEQHCRFKPSLKLCFAFSFLFIILTGVLYLYIFNRHINQTSVVDVYKNSALKAVKFLISSQEDDGSWPVAKLGGDDHYKIALSAISALVIASDLSINSIQDSIASVKKAIVWILSQQKEGLFGQKDKALMYNHGIATFALANIIASTNITNIIEKELIYKTREAIAEAVNTIIACQNSNGSWSYRPEDDGNLGVTVWQINALISAEKIYKQNITKSIEKAIRWVIARENELTGEFSYGYLSNDKTHPSLDSLTLTAMGLDCLITVNKKSILKESIEKNINIAIHSLQKSLPEITECCHDIDYYSLYFLSKIMRYKFNPTDPSYPLKPLLSRLLTMQINSGKYKGSWRPDNRWYAVGGTIYNTVIPAISLIVNMGGAEI